MFVIHIVFNIGKLILFPCKKIIFSTVLSIETIKETKIFYALSLFIKVEIRCGKLSFTFSFLSSNKFIFLSTNSSIPSRVEYMGIVSDPKYCMPSFNAIALNPSWLTIQNNLLSHSANIIPFSYCIIGIIAYIIKILNSCIP